MGLPKCAAGMAMENEVDLTEEVSVAPSNITADQIRELKRRCAEADLKLIEQEVSDEGNPYFILEMRMGRDHRPVLHL